jgi:hypothetical protein
MQGMQVAWNRHRTKRSTVARDEQPRRCALEGMAISYADRPVDKGKL